MARSARAESWLRAFPARALPAAALSFVIALIAYPLAKPGYVLLLDAPFGPRFRSFAGFPPALASVSASFPINVLLTSAHSLPADALVGKTFIVGALAAAAFGAMLIVPANTPARLFAGLFAVTNPFVLDRLVAGQMGIVWGVALLPLAAGAILRFVARPSLKLLAASALSFAAVAAFSEHLAYLFPWFAAIAFVAYCASQRTALQGVTTRLAWLVALALVSGLLELYWLVPTLLSGGGVVQRFSLVDVYSFATSGIGSTNVVLSAASLHGFWYEASGPGVSSVSWVLFGGLTVLCAVGAVALWRRRESRWLCVAAAGAWLLAMFVVLGVSTGLTARPWLFLFDHLPGFAGLREPEKASAYLVLIYGGLGAVGVQSIARTMSDGSDAWAKFVSPVLVLALLLAYGAPLLSGAGGRLDPVQYPASWYDAARIIGRGNRDGAKTLFLPWHQYMQYPFAGGRLLAPPAPNFFPGDVIAGDLHLGATAADGSTVSSFLDAVIADRSEIHRFGALIAPLGVKYVLLAHTLDFEQYGFLNRSPDLVLVKEWKDLSLYENRAYQGTSFLTVGQTTVPDVTHLLRLGRSQDTLTTTLYEVAKPPAGDPVVAPSHATSDATWRVFSVAFNPRLRWHGERPVLAYGAVTAFPSVAGATGSKLGERGREPMLLAMAVSALTALLVAAALVLRTARRR